MSRPIGHSFLHNSKVEISRIDQNETVNLNQVLHHVVLKAEKTVKRDHLVSANAKVEIAKAKCAENIEEALQNTANLERLDDKTEQLKEMAGNFNDDAEELYKVMLARKRRTLAYGAAVGGAALGMVVFPIIQVTCHIAG